MHYFFGQKSLTLKNQKTHWSFLSIKKTLEIETPESALLTDSAIGRWKALGCSLADPRKCDICSQPLGGKGRGSIN
jgi:hypothetical protein